MAWVGQLGEEAWERLVLGLVDLEDEVRPAVRWRARVGEGVAGLLL